MGVNADTPTNLIAGAGEVYRNQVSLGASSGPNNFRIERELVQPQLNGTKGKLIGTDYVLSSEGVLETGFPEVSSAVLAAGWPGSSAATVGTVTTISEDNTRRIGLTAYADWEVQLERLGGGEIQFELDNAIQTGNYEGEFNDEGFFVPRVELRDRWDPADLSVSPHRIKIMTAIS